MTSHPAHAGPTAPPRPAAAAPARMPGWGWLEWFAIAQTFIPAMVFIPGISPVRSVVRVASYIVALVAWIAVYLAGRRRTGDDTFPSQFWLKGSAGMLLLMIFHPSGNSIQAAVAQVLIYLAVLSPAFWAPSALNSSRQIGRVMAILFLCNAAGAAVGLGQVFRPGTFNPPVINFAGEMIDASDTDAINRQEQVIKTDDGKSILRPCGLTDGPGGAAPAATAAALLGMAFALRPIGAFKRAVSLGLAFIGVAVIYYSQVRSSLIMIVVCWMVLGALFSVTKNYAQATALAVLASVLILGAGTWVTVTSGSEILKRFVGLVTTDIGETMTTSGRSGFLRESFDRLIWEYPLGAGLGWWGTIYGAFGDKSIPTKVWVETMIPAWIIDGGIPLLLLYCAAIFFAMADTLRIAFRSTNRELGFWAAVVFASNLATIAACISFVPFLMTAGVQFWMLSAILHVADAQSRKPDAMPDLPRPPGRARA